MNHRTLDRRRARRYRAADRGIVSARVRPGRDVSIVDVSESGALLESQHRLLPGTHVELHFQVLHRRAQVRGRVLRCAIVTLRPTSVCYRSAIGFERRLPWFSEGGLDGYGLPTGDFGEVETIGADATPAVV